MNFTLAKNDIPPFMLHPYWLKRCSVLPWLLGCHVPCASSSIKLNSKMTWQLLVWKVAQQKKKKKTKQKTTKTNQPTSFELDQLLLGRSVHINTSVRTRGMVAVMGKASWNVSFAESTALGRLTTVAMWSQLWFWMWVRLSREKAEVSRDWLIDLMYVSI